MSTLQRQNALFVSEDWVRVYEALQNVDFRSLDYNTLVQTLMGYVRVNYPEQFNDWVASSEFVMKVEILAYLAQNLTFRMDLNSRENFVATAERRESLLNLARNVGYKVNRVRAGTGQLKVMAVSTNEPVIDSSGRNLQNVRVLWNDPRDEDWYERFVLILNAAFSARTQFGFPANKNTTSGVTTEQYILDSASPIRGVYTTTAKASGQSVPLDIINATIDSLTGAYSEVSPSGYNAFNLLYQNDGKGFASTGTGFMLPCVQGSLKSQSVTIDAAVSHYEIDLSATNIAEDSIIVQQLNADGTVLRDWTKVDTTFGDGLSFNTISGTNNFIYEVDTLPSDSARIRFGDGAYGVIPTGQFRIWYRVSDATALTIPAKGVSGESVSMPYANGNQNYNLTLTYSLETGISNGAITESNADIRRRIGKVFYTQNRLISAQDYNNFFLRDSSVAKTKTTNRNYTGRSRYARLTDPTGVYQSVQHVASDGRLFHEDLINTNTADANVSVVSIDALYTKYIQNVVNSVEKQSLYLNKYPELVFSGSYTWVPLTTDPSKGNFAFGGVRQILGSGGSNGMERIQTDAIVRLGDATGSSIVVQSVTGDGTADGAVQLRESAEASRLFSVYPPIRGSFSTDEESTIKTRLSLKRSFGVSWDATAMEWFIIDIDDVGDGDFDITNQHDVTKNNKDASWIIKCVYTRDGSIEKWTITDRGSQLAFDSTSEIDFVHTNNDQNIIDPETGETVTDTITILPCNESRDSPRRRGLDSEIVVYPSIHYYDFVGDGITKSFKTSEAHIDPTRLSVTLGGRAAIYLTDFTIDTNVTGDSIVFHVAPAIGQTIRVGYGGVYQQIEFGNLHVVADGVTNEYDLGNDEIVSNNTFVFQDGINQIDSFSFGIGDTAGSSELVVPDAVPLNIALDVIYLKSIPVPQFSKYTFGVSGTQSIFYVSETNLTDDDVIIFIDGVAQQKSTYNVSTDGTQGVIHFVTAPPAGVYVQVVVNRTNKTFATSHHEFVGDGTTNAFLPTADRQLSLNGSGIIVTIDGVQQSGPLSGAPKWIVVNNQISFTTPPHTNAFINVFVMWGGMGIAQEKCSTTIVPGSRRPAPSDIEGGLVRYLGRGLPLIPTGTLKHPDGYLNPNGLLVNPIDGDSDGYIDEPFLFKNLVIQDNVSDLVLWRKIVENGFDVMSPIDANSVPKGTYGGDISAGTALRTGDIVDTIGDIYYNSGSKQWFVASASSWELAPNQANYKVRIGRSDLQFVWEHVAPDDHRIDPAKSNIMDVYILTQGYLTEYNTWINSGASGTEPEPETSQRLQLQYGNFDDYKAISDTIIYHPSRFKPLFGDNATAELQADFKVIQSSGSTISEADLKLRILSTISQYFEVSRWEFGEKFYFTELAAFIHSALAPNIQSIVIVPRYNDQAFGRLFQVRAEPDELFVSTASVDHISIVQNFTDEEIRLGTYN